MTITRTIVAIVLALAVAGGVAILPATARSSAESTTLPDPRSDIGTGERLVVLVAGEFATEDEAVRANERIAFEDVAGFVVARSDDFDGFAPGRFLLVTAFRTIAGADDFERLAHAATPSVRRVVTRYTGTTWIGLGQEAHPDGTGPLVGPLPAGHPQRLR